MELLVFRHRRNLAGYSQPKEQHMFISYPPSTPSVTYTSSAAAAAGLYCRGAAAAAGASGSDGAACVGGSRAASTGSTVSAMLTCNSGVLRHHAVSSCCSNDDVIGAGSTEMTSPFDAMLFGGGTACQDVLPSKTYACTAHIPSLT